MFKIYYDDGSNFEGGIPRQMIDPKYDPHPVKETLFPQHIPPFGGVVAIAQYMREVDIVDLLTGKHYYVWNVDHWVGGDLWQVMTYMEEKAKILKYSKRKMEVKSRGKWRKVGEVDLYAQLAKSGWILQGTMEKGEFLLGVMQEIQNDFAKIDIERFRLPRGTVLRANPR